MLSFLDTIWGRQGEGVAEFRLLNGTVQRMFGRWPQDQEELIEVAQLNLEHNVFFGVVLRDTEGGTNKDVKAYTPVLWADFDIKRYSESKLKTLQAVQRMEVDPQIIVDSGHGYHTYWLLDKPVPVREAQIIMSRMADRFGSDTVGDPARVMRLPGTLNVKDPLHKVPVRIMKFDSTGRTRAADVYDLDAMLDEKRDRYVSIDGRGAPDLTGLWQWTQYCPPKGERSEYIFGICCRLIRQGYSEESAFELLIQQPAGEKMREMVKPERWFRTTWNNAMKEVTGERS